MINVRLNCALDAQEWMIEFGLEEPFEVIDVGSEKLHSHAWERNNVRWDRTYEVAAVEIVHVGDDSQTVWLDVLLTVAFDETEYQAMYGDEPEEAIERAVAELGTTDWELPTIKFDGFVDVIGFEAAAA